MLRQPFTNYPEIPEEQHLKDTNFNLWLQSQPKRLTKNFMVTFKAYLEQYGFDIKKHTIAPEQVKYHSYVYQNRGYFKHQLKGGSHGG